MECTRLLTSRAATAKLPREKSQLAKTRCNGMTPIGAKPTETQGLTRISRMAECVPFVFLETQTTYTRKEKQ